MRTVACAHCYALASRLASNLTFSVKVSARRTVGLTQSWSRDPKMQTLGLHTTKLRKKDIQTYYLSNIHKSRELKGEKSEEKTKLTVTTRTQTRAFA